jgi:hypothetical protein
MAKVKQPLFSFGASGTVAKKITFNQSLRVTTVRSKPSSHTAPSNPQLQIRQNMRDAAYYWRTMPPTDKQAWKDLVQGRPIYSFSKFLKEWFAQGASLLDPPRIPMA